MKVLLGTTIETAVKIFGISGLMQLNYARYLHNSFDIDISGHVSDADISRLAFTDVIYGCALSPDSKLDDILKMVCDEAIKSAVMKETSHTKAAIIVIDINELYDIRNIVHMDSTSYAQTSEYSSPYYSVQIDAYDLLHIFLDNAIDSVEIWSVPYFPELLPYYQFYYYHPDEMCKSEQLYELFDKYFDMIISCNNRRIIALPDLNDIKIICVHKRPEINPNIYEAFPATNMSIRNTITPET